MHQDPETETAKWNKVVFNLISYTYCFYCRGKTSIMDWPDQKQKQYCGKNLCSCRFHSVICCWFRRGYWCVRQRVTTRVQNLFSNRTVLPKKKTDFVIKIQDISCVALHLLKGQVHINPLKSSEFIYTVSPERLKCSQWYLGNLRMVEPDCNQTKFVLWVKPDNIKWLVCLTCPHQIQINM